MKLMIKVLFCLCVFFNSHYCFSLDNGYDPGTEFQVNTYTADSQSLPVLASNGSTSYFVIWQSNEQDCDGQGIFGQKLNKYTSPVNPELQINTYTLGNQRVPDISSDGTGYLAVWSSWAQDGDYWGIYGQIIDSAGLLYGPEFRVNTAVLNIQDYPAVASNTSGYLVVWEHHTYDGDGSGVFGQLLDPAGTKIGSEIQINTYTTDNQLRPSLVSNGTNYLVVWHSESQDGSGFGVFAQILNNAGTKIGSEFQVNTYTLDDQTIPSVASDGSRYLVAWNSFNQDGSMHGVYAQLLDSNGTKIGSEMQVNVYTTYSQYSPAVAYNGLDYLIVWQSFGQDGDRNGVYGQFIDNAGVKIGSEFLINTYTADSQQEPSVTVLGSGFLVSWGSALQDNDGFGVFSKKLTYIGPQITGHPLSKTVHEGENATFKITASTHHGGLQYRWYKNGVLVSSASSYTISGVTMADNDSEIYCIVSDPLKNIQSFSATLTVLPNYQVQSETVVNSYPNGCPADVSAVSDGDGYFLAWSYPVVLGSNNEIAGQLFDSDGTKIGAEIPVNTPHISLQGAPDVATNGNNYCVVWSSYVQDGDDYGVFGQFLDNDGTKIGSEFQVNTTTTDSQFHPSVESDGTDYLVVWQDEDSENVIAQLFYSNGTKNGSEFSLFTEDCNGYPRIASSGLHYLVVCFGDPVANVNMDVYGQLLFHDGMKLGTNFLVNDYTAGWQGHPDVVYTGSGYVAAWHSYGSDSDGYGVVGQRINGNGTILPPEFNINTYTSDDQKNVALAYNGTDFLAVWQSYYQDGSSYSIYGQFFDTNLNPIGTEFRVNSYSSGYQTDPAVTSNGTDFMVAWQSNGDVCQTIIKDISLAITDHPADQSVDEQDSAEFNVTAYTRHGSLHYQWYKNGVMAGTDSDTFVIPSLSMADNDTTVYCVVSDDKSSVQSDTAKLNVLPLMKILQHPVSQSVYVGEPVTFSIVADSSVPFHYQWYQIKGMLHIPIGSDNDSVTLSDPQLSDDHTQFYCVVSNYAHYATSKQAYLTVLEPAFVLSIAGDDNIMENSGSQYTAYADYGGGLLINVTTSAGWSVDPSGYGHITSTGYMYTGSVDQDETVMIRAVYNDGSEIHDAYFELEIENIFNVVDMLPSPDSVQTSSPENIVINCSEPIKPASVTTSTCVLIEPGNDGLFFTGDDLSMPVTPSVENLVDLNLELGNYLLPNSKYRVFLSGVTNMEDQALDGEFSGSFPSGDGNHGGIFVADFDMCRQFESITYNDNDTVTLVWKPFRTGIIYRIESTDSLVSPQWNIVEPQIQWPIDETEWTGDTLVGVDQRFYRAVGVFAYIKSVSPDHAGIGTYSLDVQIRGYGTKWYQNQTAVNFGNGITVLAIQVNSSSNMVVTISIDILAKFGYRDITIRTGPNTEVKENGFRVDSI